MSDQLDLDQTQADLHQADVLPPPKWPLPVGIISTVLGGLGLVCGGLGLAFTPFVGGMVSGQLNGAPPPPTMQFGPTDYTLAGIGLLFSILLLAAGIMLIGRVAASRWMHLLYAVGVIPVQVLNILHQSAKQAAMAQWAADYPDNPIAQAFNSGAPSQSIGPMIGMAVGVGLGIGYPLFLFLWFMAVKTKPQDITGTRTGVY